MSTAERAEDLAMIGMTKVQKFMHDYEVLLALGKLEEVLRKADTPARGT